MFYPSMLLNTYSIISRIIFYKVPPCLIRHYLLKICILNVIVTHPMCHYVLKKDFRRLYFLDKLLL